MKRVFDYNDLSINDIALLLIYHLGPSFPPLHYHRCLKVNANAVPYMDGLPRLQVTVLPVMGARLSIALS
jgi:hypothetical protein